MRPSRTGWRDVRAARERIAPWHVKQVSSSDRAFRPAGPSPACGTWHDAQPTPLRSWRLPAQWVRRAPSWQPRHGPAFDDDTGDAGDAAGEGEPAGIGEGGEATRPAANRSAAAHAPAAALITPSF